MRGSRRYRSTAATPRRSSATPHDTGVAADVRVRFGSGPPRHALPVGLALLAATATTVQTSVTSDVTTNGHSVLKHSPGSNDHRFYELKASLQGTSSGDN